MARNGSVVSSSTTASPLPPNAAASPASPEQPASASATVRPPVPTQPKKQGLFHKLAHLGSDKGHARKDSTGSAAGDTESKTTSLISGTAPLAASPTPETPALSASQTRNRGPIFGVRISEAPPLAYAVSIIGGQRHQLPILVFSLVEAIFRRGIETPGIFRMNGDAAAIARLIAVYNTYPSYGDDINLNNETLFTLCDLLKRYLKDLPEAIMSRELWQLFIATCLTGADTEHDQQLASAQIIFRL